MIERLEVYRPLHVKQCKTKRLPSLAILDVNIVYIYSFFALIKTMTILGLPTSSAQTLLFGFRIAEMFASVIKGF